MGGIYICLIHAKVEVGNYQLIHVANPFCNVMKFVTCSIAVKLHDFVLAFHSVCAERTTKRASPSGLHHWDEGQVKEAILQSAEVRRRDDVHIHDSFYLTGDQLVLDQIGAVGDIGPAILQSLCLMVVFQEVL